MVEYSQNLGAPPCVVSPPSQGKDSYKKLGLTKEVLAAHTQKEEQLFLFRFKDLCGLDALKPNCSQCLEPKGEEIRSNGMIIFWFILFKFIHLLIVTSSGHLVTTNNCLDFLKLKLINVKSF